MNTKYSIGALDQKHNPLFDFQRAFIGFNPDVEAITIERQAVIDGPLWRFSDIIKPGYFSPVMCTTRQRLLKYQDLLRFRPECLRAPSYTFFAFPGTREDARRMQEQ